MSKDYSFSVMPSVSISRSRFARKSQHKTTFNLGDIVPIYVDEVLPGDTRSFDMASLVRMSTPITALMDNVFVDYYAFFCPNRLTWIHWKEFMGENNASAGIPSSNYTIPYIGISSNPSATIDVGSYWDYFGLPVGTGLTPANLGGIKVSALPFRALALIYNRWFRNQNVIAPLAVQTGDTNEVIVGQSTGGNVQGFVYKTTSILKAAKVADYFTKGLPYAQKGAAVSIPLGTTAPVIGASTGHSIGSNGYQFGNMLGTGGTFLPFSNDKPLTLHSNKLSESNGSTQTAGDTISASNLVADLSNATAATINQLRYAFQLQKLLEKDALYGTRYWEILNAHFGVQAPDASLQDPEYLGGWRQRVNIDQVLQTTGGAPSTSSELGMVGANSVTGGKSSLFTKSFVEHGYIIVVAVARHEQTYTEGVNRMWTRQGRYDFYFPVFANLGAQEIKNKEIFAGTSSSDNEGIFAYQEAWAEYRYRPSVATSLLRPGVSGSLNYWTLANNFGTLPTLGKVFIEQGRQNISRALVTSSSGPDFIADFYFQDIAVRPMPMYSIPGLIDHH